MTGQGIGLIVEGGENCGSADKSNQKIEAEVQDWRVPIITYYTFNYALIDDKLHRRTADDLLLKCLGADQTRIAVGKWAPKNKIFYPYSGTTAVIDHGITTRRAGAELL